MEPKQDLLAILGGQADHAKDTFAARQVEASLGKWAAMGNPEMQAIGSKAKQVGGAGKS